MHLHSMVRDELHSSVRDEQHSEVRLLLQRLGFRGRATAVLVVVEWALPLQVQRLLVASAVV